MKLVLDANIFISAFYWDGSSQEIINRIIEGQDELYISNEIINEVSAVMARPKFKTGSEIISIKDFFEMIGGQTVKGGHYGT